METYKIEELTKNLKISNTIDIERALCNNGWNLFSDKEENNTLYVFMPNGTILITIDGSVKRGKWNYITVNKSFVISDGEKEYMMNPVYVDDKIFILNMSGTDDYLFMINEQQNSALKFSTLNDIKNYLSIHTFKLEDNIREETIADDDKTSNSSPIEEKNSPLSKSLNKINKILKWVGIFFALIIVILFVSLSIDSNDLVFFVIVLPLIALFISILYTKYKIKRLSFQDASRKLKKINKLLEYSNVLFGFIIVLTIVIALLDWDWDFLFLLPIPLIALFVTTIYVQIKIKLVIKNAK